MRAARGGKEQFALRRHVDSQFGNRDRVGEKDYPGSDYNPFIFSEGKRIKHWLAQPEFRYWTCERFNGWFFGVHLHGGEFSFAKVRLPFNLYTNLRDNRYEGYYYGGGLSAGYQWMLGKRWNLEATLGLGYARVEYDRYRCADCSPKVGSGSKNYFGPTKAAVSLIYFIL